MPYIGNTAANRFVASKSASVFSGNGSNTSFTLDHGVGSDEDILVSVDGVIQEPSVAYSVSGTTLTFTAAPSSNSGNNIFVYYLFRTVGTVSHPSSNALEATSGTFTGDVAVDTDTLFADATNDKVGINNASPNHELQINGNSTTASLSLKTSATGNTTSDGLELKVQGDSAAYLYNYENAMLRFGTNGLERMRIDANGHVTMPSQCGFLVHRNSTLTNFAKDTSLTQTFATEVFDTNGDFSGTTFTAPVDGFYFLHASARLADVDTGANYYFIQINTSSRSTTDIMRPAFSSDGDYHQLRAIVYQQMDAGDTAVVNIQQSGGTTGQTDVSSSSAYTFFNGYLVN